LRRYLPFAILALVLILDQGSKILVRDYFQPVEQHEWYTLSQGVLESAGLGEADITVRLPRPPAIRLIGDVFWINFHENKGVAFGFLSGLPQSVTVPLFAVIALLALGFITHFYRSLPEGRLLPRIALMGIMGGAIGNLIDRLFLGKVTDFFDLALRTPASYKNLWPIFNVADICIVVGVSVLFLVMLFEKKGETKSGESPAADSGNAREGEPQA